MIPSSLKERYELMNYIGSGANGSVFKVRDKMLNNVVALKLLSRNATKDQILRFQQEAKATSKLNHPNIVSIFNFGTAEEGDVYMVIEFIEGKTLADFIKLDFKFSEAQYLEIFKQLSAGMAHAHKNEILHRDLKPGNILISEDKNKGTKITVIDFGIAKVLGVGVQLTTGKIAIGTPAYMSPEQGRAEEVDKRSDVYSFGCIAYEVLSGKKPFEGDNALEVLYNHSEKEAPLLEPDLLDLDANFIAEVGSLINKCLEKDKNRRFKNFEQIEDHLSNLEITPKSGSNEPDQDYETEKESLLNALSEIEKNKLKGRKSYQVILYSVLVLLLMLACILWNNLSSLEKPLPNLAKEKKQTATLSVTGKSKGSFALDYFSEIPELPQSLKNASDKSLKYVAEQRHKQMSFAEEIAVLNELLKRKPDDRQILYRRAKALLELTYDKAALEDVKKLVKQKPELVHYQTLYAHCLTRSQTPDQAIETFNKFIARFPKEVQFRRGKLRLLYGKKKYDLVVEEANKILKLEKTDYTSRKLRGRSYLYLGKTDQAINDFSYPINHGGKHVELRYHRALAYKKKNQPQKALADLDYIIEAPERSGTASYNLALKERIKLYEELGQKEKAERDRKRLYSGN